MKIELTLPVIYFSTYFLFILVASIYCALDVNKAYFAEKAKRKQARNELQKQQQTTNNEKEKAVIDIQQDVMKKTKAIGCKWYIKTWTLLLYDKKKVYFEILPYLFDQATDFALVAQYYEYKETGEYDEVISASALFYLSVAILILHRIISCFGVYLLTKNMLNVMLQAFDLLIIRCIYTNHTLNSTEPTSMQRYLSILEAAFEAMPQLLLSTVFLLKTDSFDPTIVVSLVSSIWSLTSRVTSDDKSIFKKEWKSLDFEYNKCPILNAKYLLRVLARFLEIASRLTLLTLLWINIGGFGTSIILSFELVVLIIICYGYESFGCIGNLMYFVEDDGKIHKFNWTDTLLIIFMLYKLLSQYIYLIIITVFANTPFESDKIDSFELRNKVTMEYPFGFSLFLFCWISSILFPILGKYVVNKGTHAGKFNSYKLSTSRHVDHLYRMHCYQDIFEMIEVGKEVKQLDIDYLTKIANGKSKRDEIEIEESDQKHAQLLLKEIQTKNKLKSEHQREVNNLDKYDKPSGLWGLCCV